MRDRRLNALRRKFLAAWKEQDRRGVVIELPCAARSKGVRVTKGLFDRLIDAFESSYRAGRAAFENRGPLKVNSSTPSCS
jgi:hypothetical protein